MVAAHVHALGQQLPGLTRGQGDLESAFDRYQPVPGRSAAGRGAEGVQGRGRVRPSGRSMSLLKRSSKAANAATPSAAA
ncbi:MULTISPECIES: hypothetical protein [unclassified Streptomyces]|uniref:hypothetical protein n=1 Tax=unclassified Streptomyces TaxID=2593676 RepID=UPI002E0D9855|nr:hypothetical protein OG243_02105 [Streptomyces sp. NBC_01318]